MPRHRIAADFRRHLLPLPPEIRERQPFLWDGRNLIAPWARTKRALPEADQQRLDAVATRIIEDDLDGIVWLWPDDDREPVEVGNVARTWLQHFAKDRAVYRI